MITWSQLLELGLTAKAVRHRERRGRLRRVRRGVYAVGRPDLKRLDWLLADVLSCGRGAVASQLSAAGVWEIRPLPLAVEVTVPAARRIRRPGIKVHRRTLGAEDLGRHQGIPVTSPIQTLIDIATQLRRDSLEAAVNEADKLDLVDPETLRSELDRRPGQLGVPALRRTLDRRTYTMTDTELERRFLPIARRAGLPKPQTQRWINGFKVDFWWPELSLVVETDGLRYHRTPAEQAKDRVKDQTHRAEGLDVVPRHVVHPALLGGWGCLPTQLHRRAADEASR